MNASMRQIWFILLWLAASAQIDEQIYTQKYMRGLRRMKYERKIKGFITQGLHYVVNHVLTSAKSGLSKEELVYEGCQKYNRLLYETAADKRILTTYGINKEECDKIVTGIKVYIFDHFPDSNDSDMKKYILNWE